MNPFPSLAAADLEQQMLYHPTRALDGTPRDAGLSFEDVRLLTADQVHIQGWWIPTADGRGPVMLYCHGNGGNISHRIDRARLYHALGIQVFLFDYQGYGQSDGTPDEQGTYRDAEAAWRYLTETRKIPAASIVLYGESLGCAIALETALRHPGAGLILEAPFTSTVDMARRLFPSLPVERMIRNHYNNFGKIAALRVPLLILHSPSDQTVPFTMGQALFSAAPEPKTFVALRGSHFLGYHESGAVYSNALKAFLM